MQWSQFKRTDRGPFCGVRFRCQRPTTSPLTDIFDLEPITTGTQLGDACTSDRRAIQRSSDRGSPLNPVYLQMPRLPHNVTKHQSCASCVLDHKSFPGRGVGYRGIHPSSTLARFAREDLQNRYLRYRHAAGTKPSILNWDPE